MSYDNTNSGILRANKNRQKDTHPTHQGSINVDGKEYWVSAWVNTGKEGSKLSGEKYFSMKLKPKDEPQKQGSAPSPHAGTVEGNLARHNATEDFDDDVPFAFAIAFPIATLLAVVLHGASNVIA
jgi:hypothetical protein